MISSLQSLDPELDLLNISPKDIVDSITLQDVQTFLSGLGVEQIIVDEEKGQIICPTICHHRLDEATSMKLYWYQNYKIFKCYTECNEAMSIFTLYKKFMALNYHEVSFYEAVDYISKCIKHITISIKSNYSYNNIDFEKYNFDAAVPILTEYPKTMLTYFTHYYHPTWLKDGIKPDVMDRFHIGFSLTQNKIIIPHLDINGRLVGIRGRAIDQQEIENFGKYRPVQIGNILYTHPLQFNLYGIYEHQNGIRMRKSALIVEGEKSVLLADGYYGKLSNTVACCGSSVNKYHINLLVNMLGVNEIIIGLDKEYETWPSEKASIYRKKIEKICNKYKHLASFSYIWDRNNLLQEKDSPLDQGKEVFEQLLKERVYVI